MVKISTVTNLRGAVMNQKISKKMIVLWMGNGNCLMKICECWLMYNERHFLV